MIRTDEDALECDLLETYGIMNYRELPLSRAALFSVGLRDDSRIKIKLSNMECSTDRLLSAMTVDRLSYLLWINTEDGRKGINRPESIAEKFMNTKNKSEYTSCTVEEFESWRNSMLEE